MNATDFLAFLKTAAESAAPPKTLAEFRGQFDGLTASMQVPPGVVSENKKVGGVDVLYQTAAGTTPDATIIYCHGGGYVLGSTQTHASLTGHMALETGCAVYSVEYRLAPENPWPAPVDDVCAVYEALLDLPTAPGRIFLAGDSAGGGLVLAAMLAARQRGLPTPAGLVLFSPWCDLTNSGWSHGPMATRDFVCSAAVLTTCAAYYTGGIEPAHSGKSPLFGDLSGLPPMMVHVGSEEILLSDSTRLAERAGAAGIPVQLKVWPLMPHVFPLFVDFLDEAKAAIGEAATWINAYKTG